MSLPVEDIFFSFVGRVTLFNVFIPHSSVITSIFLRVRIIICMYDPLQTSRLSPRLEADMLKSRNIMLVPRYAFRIIYRFHNCTYVSQ